MLTVDVECAQAVGSDPTVAKSNNAKPTPATKAQAPAIKAQDPDQQDTTTVPDGHLEQHPDASTAACKTSSSQATDFHADSTESHPG